MPRKIFCAKLTPIFLFLTFASCHAQTLSNCRPAPSLPPNAKPGVGGLAISHDGKTLVIAGGDGKIRFLNMATGEVLRILTGHTNVVYRSIFTSDEKLIASSSRDRTARTWDVAIGQESRQSDGCRC